MGWPAHNPELYDMICKRGLCWKFANTLKEYGYEWQIATDQLKRDEIIDALVDVLYDQSDLQASLVLWASKDISEAEGSYFSGLANV